MFVCWKRREKQYFYISNSCLKFVFGKMYRYFLGIFRAPTRLVRFNLRFLLDLWLWTYFRLSFIFREHKRTEYEMNIFRLLGDLSHLLAILILLAKIWKTRSCAGKCCVIVACEGFLWADLVSVACQSCRHVVVLGPRNVTRVKIWAWQLSKG